MSHRSSCSYVRAFWYLLRPTTRPVDVHTLSTHPLSHRCASCGTSERRCYRVVERFSHAEVRGQVGVKQVPSGSFPARWAQNMQSSTFANGLTRYGQRLLCNECCRECAGCGFRYVPSANHAHACLPCGPAPPQEAGSGRAAHAAGVARQLRAQRTSIKWPSSGQRHSHGSRKSRTP